MQKQLGSIISKKRYLAFVIPGLTLIILGLMFFASGSVKAQATGDWRSAVSGEGYIVESYPAHFHYDIKLHLDSGGSGSIITTCSQVTDVLPGWEESYDMIGRSETQSVSYTSSGSGISMTFGYSTCQVTIIGNSMTGDGTFNIDGTTYTYHFNLIRDTSGGGGGGGDIGLGDLTVPATGAAVAAGAVGLGASLAGIGGSVSASAAVLPPPPPPLQPPQNSLPLPLMQADPQSGKHLVPADAPIQADAHDDWNNNGTKRCTYCGQQTLSPFDVGWVCTNAICPARREGLTHGYTHHNNYSLAWRKSH